MNPLKSLPMTIGLGFALAIVISISYTHIGPDMPMWSLVTWLHVFFGIIWIAYFTILILCKCQEWLLNSADKDGLMVLLQLTNICSNSSLLL